MLRHLALKHATVTAFKNSAGFPACSDLHSLETISENTNNYVQGKNIFKEKTLKSFQLDIPCQLMSYLRLFFAFYLCASGGLNLC